MKQLFTLSVCILCGLLCAAQNMERPKWADGYFMEAENSYIETVSATHSNSETARSNAIKQIIARRGLSTGTDANVSIDGRDLTVEGEHGLIVKSRIVDEFHERTSSGYTVYLLVQTAKNPTYPYERVRVTNDYPFSPGVFLPGLAQFKKGQQTKGIVIVGSEVVMIAGAVMFQSLSNGVKKERDYYYDSNGSHTDHYSSRAYNYTTYETWIQRRNTTRNIFIVGAVGVYLWNVVDGLVSKGEKHVLIGDAQLHFAPYASLSHQGLMMSINF